MLSNKTAEVFKMKRDIELIRKILIVLEEDEAPEFTGEFNLDGVDQEIIDYHLELIKDAGLIKGNFQYGDNRLLFVSLKLTNEGHDFIFAAKNETVWAKFKKKLGSEMQNVPIAVAVPLLIDFSKSYFKNLVGG